MNDYYLLILSGLENLMVLSLF